MPEHSRFEELCALALVGQISPEDSAELQAHLKGCPACRSAQADFVEIESMWLSPATDPEVLCDDMGSTLSQRVLGKMQAAGARFSKPVVKEVGGSRRFNVLEFRSYSAPAYAVAAAVLLIVGSFAGFEIASRPNQGNVVATRVVFAVPSVAKIRSESHVSSSPTPEELTQKLAAAEENRTRVQAQLQEAERQLKALQASNSQNAAQIAQLKAAADAARADAANAETQVAKLKDAQGAKDADLIAAMYRAKDAEDKLSEQVAALHQERQLRGAAAEIRDVISARNLHIIDVADVTNSGVKKSFGRVFYTEGKSLIFYAYDLSSTKGKQSFTAWGSREGDPHSTKVLGVLLNDDQGQRRWALKYSDSKVLAEIDSVFVTLEPTDKPGDAPRGKKLLNAYLGTPANHP